MQSAFSTEQGTIRVWYVKYFIKSVSNSESSLQAKHSCTRRLSYNYYCSVLFIELGFLFLFFTDKIYLVVPSRERSKERKEEKEEREREEGRKRKKRL